MRKIFITLLLITLVSACKKEEDTIPLSPMEQLPPITEIGANTGGCLVNGEAFLPDNSVDDRPLNLIFHEGGYGGSYFSFRIESRVKGEVYRIRVILDRTMLVEGAIYDLDDRIGDEFYHVGLYDKQFSTELA